MNKIPHNIKQLLFDKGPAEPLTDHEEQLWAEWLGFNETYIPEPDISKFPQVDGLILHSAEFNQAMAEHVYWRKRKIARWKEFKHKAIDNDPGVKQFLRRRPLHRIKWFIINLFAKL